MTHYCLPCSIEVNVCLTILCNIKVDIYLIQFYFWLHSLLIPRLTFIWSTFISDYIVSNCSWCLFNSSWILCNNEIDVWPGSNFWLQSVGGVARQTGKKCKGTDRQQRRLFTGNKKWKVENVGQWNACIIATRQFSTAYLPAW